MNSNLKSVDVNVPGQWLTKAKKEWSKGWPNLESWNFSVQTHALLSSILPSSSKLQRLRRFQSFLNGWGNSFSSNQTRYIFLVVYERKLLEALVHLFFFFLRKLSCEGLCMWQLCATMISWVGRWVELVVYQKIQCYQINESWENGNNRNFEKDLPIFCK